MKMAVSDNDRYIVQVFVGSLSQHYEALSVEASKQTTSAEIVACIVEQLSLDEAGGNYELAEVIGYKLGQECKERRLGPAESPVAVMLLWPKNSEEYYRFCLREKLNDSLNWENCFAMDPQLIKDYFQRFLYQPQDREYPDLCQLPDLNEQTLLENLRARFLANHIYTYVGSILIAVNPFKFHPIYNPKYVKLYQNRRLGNELPPHIFAVADAAYHCMLRERRNQCVVISGESGSGKTESTNFLLHHLTALSQKGSHGSGVEQTILSAGPVLEAFGNAKTAHNNNSSRFGKFIQVNYKENGMVHGAVVQKYLLEKSRICSQGRNERNYHIFYYLLAGASDLERQLLHLMQSDEYYYLNRSGCYTLDNVDEKYEFFRLKQSMEMVGFTSEKQRRLFAVLSAVLLLGNVEFQPRKSAYHHDESVAVRNPEVVLLISDLLKVKQETLMAALTAKRARASGETLIINYRLPEAVAARDTIAKCLYGALFDWIVLQVNHALLSKKDTLRDHQGNSIGVLDIFGFEDFGLCNSFEQFCINYANEHLQYYFNQHVFKYEQEEYRKEGIRWTDIDFMDNTGCLQLIEGKPNGLLCVLDDQCNFPGATNETLLQKFNSVHKDNVFYEIPQKREAAFIVRHYAGKVKYQVMEMREKNLDLMRQDIVGVLKNSNMAFVRELVGADPVAVFRWAIVRAFFRGFFAFNEAGKRHRSCREGNKAGYIHQRVRNHSPNELLLSHLVTLSAVNLTLNRIAQTHQLKHKHGYDKDKRATGVGANSSNKRLVNVAPTNDVKNRSNRVTWPNLSGEANKVAVDSKMKDEKRPLTTAPGCLERVLCHDEAEVMNRANQIVMKNKSFRPRERAKKGLKNLQTVKTLAGRTQSHGQQLGKARKQPLTVTAQFQHSLHSLMDTLNQANPFFIRCIKSNSDKIANKFDNETVQRQLRYTGMLETVRIRQAGYNVRLTYEEFIQLYRILLPRGLTSTQVDVRSFLLTLNLNRDNYQMGASKIFLRECEKLKLDYRLHQQIIAAIVAIQRWFRGILEQRKFQRMREAAITIQSYWRMVLSQRALTQLRYSAAASQIQRAWRGYQTSTWYKRLRINLVIFQAHARGYLTRSRLRARREKRREDSSQGKVRPERERTEGGVLDDCEFENIPPEPRKRLSRPLTRQFRGDPLDVFLTESGDNIFESGDSVDIALRPVKLKQSPKIIERAKTEQGGQEHPTELRDRKGSCDSLTSQRSSDSHAPVRDTMQRARKQIEALIGVGKSDNDTEENWHPSKSKAITQTHTHSHPPLSSFCSEPAPNTPPPLHHPLRRNIRDSHFMNQNAKYWRRGVVRTEGEEPDVPMRLIRKRDQVGRGAPEEATDGKMRDEPMSLITLSVSSLGISSTTSTLTSTMTATPAPASAPATQSRTPVWVMRSTSGARASVEGAMPPSGASGMPQITAHATKRNRCSANPSSVAGFNPADLKRRNSDPATQTTAKASLISSDIVWKGTTMFTIADHSFRKLSRFTKEDRCVSCNNPMDAIVTQGYKCSDCKQLFHTTCIQNGGVLSMPCPSPHPSGTGAPGGKPGRRKNRKPAHESKAAVEGRFSLTGTSQFTDSTDKIISDARELQLMQDFITKKIYLMESEEGKKPSRVDRVFKQALREFKDNLVATYSVVNKQGSEGLNIKYKDLIANFLHVMQTVCTQEQTQQDFPVTMGVNAFRGFMNEFMSLTRVEGEKPGRKRKKDKDKKRRVDEPIRHCGHMFVLTIINIPTACEICTSFFMWPIERGLVCQNCKLTCHKKCYSKASTECGKEGDSIQEGSSESSRTSRNKVFGVPLHLLATGDGKVPLVVDRLITTIEMYGLYTEGIYRKSGVTSKVRELKSRLEESGEDCGGPEDPVDFETYPVHVLAAVLKTFLREMPEPLLTFDCYDDFLRAAILTEPADRVSTLFAILKKLPKPNFDLMERLIFHLARVALHEDVNRMSASALAIVFAPCVLRTNKVIPAQDSLTDISRQTQCIETIIGEQLRKVRSTLADIDTLDEACHTATHRLSSLRSSKIFSAEELLAAEACARDRARHEEAMLVDHIQEMEKEKALLTSTLPSLTRASSDDDLLSTDMDDASLDDAAEIDHDGAGGRHPRRHVGRSGLDDCQDASMRQSASDMSVKQSSSDNSVTSLYTAGNDCDEDPIMV